MVTPEPSTSLALPCSNLVQWSHCSNLVQWSHDMGTPYALASLIYLQGGGIFCTGIFSYEEIRHAFISYTVPKFHTHLVACCCYFLAAPVNS